MLRLYAPLKPRNRAPGFDVIVLDNMTSITITQGEAKLNDIEFMCSNDAGESVHFRGSDVVYVAIKNRGAKCE